jgi:hypothetical protein
MTFMNESFFHVLRKWGTKHSHFSRYYSIAIWCSVLSWNENVTRPVFDYEWKRGKSGQLSSSAGRFYRVPIRPKPTDDWRREGWVRYREWAQHKSTPPTQPVESFYLGWEGNDPPSLTAAVAAAAAATAAAATAAEQPVEAMKVAELRVELAAKGLATKGKKGALAEALTLARADLPAALQAQAVKLARRELPDPPAPPADGSPTRGAAQHRAAAGTAGAAEGEADATIVRALFGLPSPYRMPTPQRKKRMAPPTGQLKLTAARTADALAAIARGEKPAPFKRHRTQAAAEAAAACADDEAEGAEGGVLHDTAMESDADGNESELDSDGLMADEEDGDDDME